MGTSSSASVRRWRHAAGRFAFALALLSLTLSPRVESAPHVCAGPWQRLSETAQELAKPLPLALLGGAVLPPLLLGPTGGDHELRVFVQRDLTGSYYAEPVTIAAPYVALPMTVALWGAAALFASCPVQRVSSALLQGAGLTLATVGLSKWVLGRTWPTGGRDPSADNRLEHPNDAQKYSPFRKGLAAFPSGHTAIMFSLASALRASAPELGVWRYAGYPIAVAVGFGMWFGDHHWASDVLSGALVGEALGGAAGRAWQPGSEDEVTISYLVLPLPHGVAAGAVGHF